MEIDVPSFLLLIFLGFSLGVILYKDVRYRVIPDGAILSLAILGYLYYGFSYPRFLGGLALGGGLLLLKKGMEKGLRRPVLGWGDVKLILVLGMGLLPSQISPFLILAGLSGCGWGAVYQGIWQEERFPFAPSLIFSFLLVQWFWS